MFDNHRQKVLAANMKLKDFEDRINNLKLSNFSQNFGETKSLLSDQVKEKEQKLTKIEMVKKILEPD